MGLCRIRYSQHGTVYFTFLPASSDRALVPMAEFDNQRIRKTTSGRMMPKRRLLYSQGDELFWDRLNKLQQKYLPTLSSFMENTETVIKEYGTSPQIHEIRNKLGYLNASLLNVQGFHNFHKRMLVLDKIEEQVKSWINAWELCAKQLGEANPAKLVQPKPTSSDEDSASEDRSSESEESSEESPEESPESESSEASSSENESEESSDSVEVQPLGFVELNDLVNRFQEFGMQEGDDRQVITSTGNKRIREGGQERLLGKSMPGFITKEKDEDELDHGERAEKKPRLASFQRRQRSRLVQ